MNSNSHLPLLHIGYGKTGTTWFQNKFYPNVQGIDFYHLKRIRKGLGAKWKDVNITPALKTNFIRNTKRLVICDESMIGRPEHFEHNAKMFRELFFPAQIVLFIRNQLDKFPSNYSQYIKSGGTSSFEQFLFGSEESFFLEKHKYDKLIDVYKNIFGIENVHVYLFEEFNNNFEFFMDKFCSFHNLSVQKGVILQTKINPSLSFPVLRLMRYSNKFTNKHTFLGRTSKRMKQALGLYPEFHFSTLFYNKLNDIIPNKRRMLIESMLDIDKIELLKDYYRKSNQSLIVDHGLKEIRNYNYPL